MASAWLAAVPPSGAVEASGDREWTPDAARALVGVIPEDYRYRCELTRRTALSQVIGQYAPSITAAVSCIAVPGLRAVRYYAFDCVDAMSSVYDEYVQGSYGPPHSDENAQGPGCHHLGIR